MNIFADYHHSGLTYSLHLTLEKRLGHTLYRPIGMEWFEQGFWDIAKPYGNNLETVQQYLQLGAPAPDGSPHLNNTTGIADHVFSFPDEYHGYTQKAITLDTFKEMEIDVIIASIPDHWYTYKRLRDQYHPKAKLIAHMGNMFYEVHTALADGTIENLMASTSEFPTPDRITRLFYYQEMPVTPTFRPTSEPVISSFAHTLPAQALYNQYKGALPEYTFKAYGAGCPDGWMNSLSALYSQTQNSSFVWHVKPGGDGFGWNWHTAYMLGRPVITNYSDYKDKLGGLLFEDMQTGVNLEARGMKENVEILRNLQNSERLAEMQERCRTRFMEKVNYHTEAGRVNSFLQMLH
jgi:hypothetical protein